MGEISEVRTSLLVGIWVRVPWCALRSWCITASPMDIFSTRPAGSASSPPFSSIHSSIQITCSRPQPLRLGFVSFRLHVADIVTNFQADERPSVASPERSIPYELWVLALLETILKTLWLGEIWGFSRKVCKEHGRLVFKVGLQHVSPHRSSVVNHTIWFNMPQHPESQKWSLNTFELRERRGEKDCQ